MADLSLDPYRGKGLSKQDLDRLLREEATKLLGSDLRRSNHGRRKRRPSCQGFGRSIWFFRDARKLFTFSRRGLRIFTLR